MVEPPHIEDITNIESDGEHQDKRELEKEVGIDDELQILDQVVTSQREDSTSGVGGAKEKIKKIPKMSKNIAKKPKQSSGDALVGVMKRFVDIKEKESNNKGVLNYQMHGRVAKLGRGHTRYIGPMLRYLQICQNCEISINGVVENDGSALAWFKIKTCKPLPNYLLFPPVVGLLLKNS
jgi:hypothetical protein